MNLTPEEEKFVKELAHRATAQNQSPGPSIRTQNEPLVILIPTKAGKVAVSPEENNKLGVICEREGKTGRELINEYL